MQSPFTVPQILAMRQWFNKRKIENLGVPLGLSVDEVRDAIKDPDHSVSVPRDYKKRFSYFVRLMP